MNHIKRLVAHMGWADRLTLDALRRAKSIDPKTIELYAHVLAAEQVWCNRLTETPAQIAVWPVLTLDECERLAGDTMPQLNRFIDGLTTADLDRDVTYKNSAGAQFTSKVEDILLHVALHGAYHRGQITLALRGNGAIPNPTDYIAFIRGAPAATRMPVSG